MNGVEAKLLPVVALALVFALPALSFAYFNVTSLTTNVYLGNSTSAQVSETLQIFISNSSISSYLQDRAAVNQTLGNWQKVLGTKLLMQHIFNPKSSIANFTLLPGPVEMHGNNASTSITMSYVAENVTTVSGIGPRQFLYTFNDSCFNFRHTASGEALFPNATLNIILPKGAKLDLPVYPIPDYPYNYANATQLSWFEGEPLNSFRLSYTITESLQQEVIGFFTHMYPQHAAVVYVLIAFAAALAITYAYRKFAK
ncbi:MAG: hypothetical protein ACP5T3_02560 [Candidatus Micrarchaeia archaeon]